MTEAGRQTRPTRGRDGRLGRGGTADELAALAAAEQQVLERVVRVREAVLVRHDVVFIGAGDLHPAIAVARHEALVDGDAAGIDDEAGLAVDQPAERIADDLDPDVYVVGRRRIGFDADGAEDFEGCVLVGLGAGVAGGVAPEAELRGVDAGKMLGALEVECSACRPCRHLYIEPLSLGLLKRLAVPDVANHLVCSVCGTRNDELKRPIHARPDARVPGVTGKYPRW